MSRWLLLCVALPLLAGAAVDPTQPPAVLAGDASSSLEAGPSPLLQAILRGPAGHRAVIGGQSLAVGEQQGDLRVLAIRTRSVLVEHQGQRRELYLIHPILTPSTRSSNR